MSLLETIRPSIVYHPTRALDDLPAELRLRNVEWGVLFAVTGEHTVAQVGDHLGLEPKVRDRAFARLVELGLVRERELDLEEYLKAVASVSDDLPKSLAQFFQAGALRPKVSGVGPPAPTQSRKTRAGTASGVFPKPKSLRELADEPDIEQTRAVPVGPRPRRDSRGTFEPLAAPAPAKVETRPSSAASPAPQPSTPPTPPTSGSQSSAAPPESGAHDSVGKDSAWAGLSATARSKRPPSSSPAETRTAIPTMARPAASGPGAPTGSPAGSAKAVLADERRLSLRAVMQHILDRAADLHTGQLDIYRVFIRVDTKLLRRNGITTLRFEDDRLIGDRELQEAITGSLGKTLGLECPPHAFVTARAGGVGGGSTASLGSV